MDLNFEDIFQFQTTAGDAILSLVVAFCCGLIISYIYRITYRGAGYPETFLYSLITLAMVTTIVIMVIGNNLARAFGLVGAMSIIRFRTAVKDAQDIMFIFFALAIGMTCGVGLYGVAISSTLVIGVLLIILTRTNIFIQKKRSYLLQFAYRSETEEQHPLYTPVLKKYCKYNKLINIKSVDEEGQTEVSFYVDLKDPRKSNEFIQKLKEINGLTRVNLYMEDENMYNT